MCKWFVDEATVLQACRGCSRLCQFASRSSPTTV